MGRVGGDGQPAVVRGAADAAAAGVRDQGARIARVPSWVCVCQWALAVAEALLLPLGL